MSSLVGRGAAWVTKAVSEKAFPESTRGVGATVLNFSLFVTDFFNTDYWKVLKKAFIVKRC